MLENLFTGPTFQTPSCLMLGMHTDVPAVARTWIASLITAGVAGFVIKDAGGVYRPGGKDWRTLTFAAFQSSWSGD